MSNQAVLECCPAFGVAALGAPQAVELAAMFKALGDPVRLRLLSLIASHPGGQACVCEISSTVDVSQPTISHHLKLLRAAGLLDCERRGTWVYYWVIPQALQQLSSLLHLDDRPVQTASECCP
jgi:ArsR family transcriptional regulator, arsenate/arsenite/antimonite-responsive transcriptional repressor